MDFVYGLAVMNMNVMNIKAQLKRQQMQSFLLFRNNSNIRFLFVWMNITVSLYYKINWNYKLMNWNENFKQLSPKITPDCT